MATTSQEYGRDKKIQNYGAIIFAVLIAVIGAFMMTITSSPQMKGASLLWIPAALQLIAGVWFGSRKGLIAGGIGAYAAGIIAYGGWGLVDIIMNPIAGGIANSLLPALLFKLFNINPDFGANPKDMMSAVVRILVLLFLVMGIGLLPLFVNIGTWSYAIAIAILILGFPLILSGIKINKYHFIVGVVICVICSFLSALIGSAGIVVGGNTWKGAFISTGIGWFLGDTVSSILGLYILACFTTRARKMGLSTS